MTRTRLPMQRPAALQRFVAASGAVCAIWLSIAAADRAVAADRIAIPTADFLDSIGVVSTFPDRGQPLARTIEMVRYGGFRWVRAGIEGLTDKGPTTVQTFLDLYRETGVKLSWGLVSGGTDLPKLIDTARTLARAGALLAIEGNNEPNNWGVTYQGRKGGGRWRSWLPVARLQRDLYKAVKNDPVLRAYPVWSISEPGAQSDNAGLQFLRIPRGAGTLMPEGTAFADVANVHNYIYHRRVPGLAPNKVWDAADPTSASKVDGLYGNFGKTWRKGFRGYGPRELEKLPRVTTETGAVIGGEVTEEIHGLHLVNVYLAQFARGYRHTAVYLLRDRTDEDGNQRFGFFAPDYTPRKAALYLHNLTSILSDRGRIAQAGQLDVALEGGSEWVHDMLLQNSDGSFRLIIWGERIAGEDQVTIRFGASQSELRIFDVRSGTEAIQSPVDSRSVTVAVSDHPIVIAIPPSHSPH